MSQLLSIRFLFAVAIIVVVVLFALMGFVAFCSVKYDEIMVLLHGALQINGIELN